MPIVIIIDPKDSTKDDPVKDELEKELVVIPEDKLPDVTPRTPPVSPSEEDPDEFAVRFSLCDSRTDLPCWSKDRTWMTEDEGRRFHLHKEHEGCRCDVTYYSFVEFEDYLLMHGTEAA